MSVFLYLEKWIFDSAKHYHSFQKWAKKTTALIRDQCDGKKESSNEA